jgi:hypothetical protein
LLIAVVVVGNVYNRPPDLTSKDYDTFGFVWTNGRIWNLHELARNAGLSPGTVLRTAIAINDRGQILCTDGQSGAPRAHGFVLTPR